ncbi:hypothetical protein [Pseudobacteriovorax antillogorgiicola]|uniref:Uncharacterized protein n=1 Tax=Pseudobacteriovorax antillogorgiicola TaxID=1513793 RepID=A0A1Y6B9R2_9BACT|nr:hypothetical protein [Pseudobacteriovorax antillogorgiicola]TCS57496.1 hypothetical protein EDD56_103236 [Pseudobacteriovorax antillogorgiicola]SMF00395.1 hypothetical protein SAMN06296036_10397 [Pseudobacteriovorax antillogorgiicola]
MDVSDLKKSIRNFQKLEGPKITADKVRTLFDSNDFKTTYAELMTEVPKELHRDLMEFAAEGIDKITNSVENVDDTDEIQYMIAINYMLLKCEWTLMNCQLNYKIMATGEDPDQIDMFKASIITALLAQVEPYLNDQATQEITTILNSRIREMVEAA